MSQAQIVKLILTTSKRGAGVPDDVCREVSELWTLDGHLVASDDPCGVTLADLRHTNIASSQDPP